jgi:nickel superoxide dismutase
MRKTIVKKVVVASAICVSAVVFSTVAHSHCQIPCGIYGDQARFDAIAENITTIEKSMSQITELSTNPKPNMNQIVRWVNNKEQHADQIGEIVTHYFMAQRIKPVAKDDAKSYNSYAEKLILLHRMLVYSMKAKQTTDLAHIEKLRDLLAEFRLAYIGRSAHDDSRQKR